MTPDQHIRRDAGSAALAKELALSIAQSPYQSAGVLAALAVAATLHPLAGIGAAAAGAAFLALRPRPSALDLLGRPPAQVETMRKDFSLTLGHDRRTDKPFVLDRQTATMNVAVFGDTGSSKTEILLGIAEQAIAQGAGTLYVDAKADVSLFPKVLALAARYGREDDVLLVDMTASRDVGVGGANRLNPFASGGPEDLAELVLDLVPSDTRSEIEATILRSLLKAALGHLVSRREQGEGFGLARIHDSLGLDFLLGLADPDGVPASDAVRKAVREYLDYLPAHNPERGQRQAAAAREQHRAIINGIAPALLSLAQTCDSVMGPGTGDVDLREAIANRRIVVVQLPVLVKCPREWSVLGRIVLATLRSTMEALLSKEDGSYGRRTAQGQGVPKPFLCVLDDVELYSLKGLALTAIRARDLGFAMLYSTPDIPSLKAGGETEARSILANTVTKAFTRVDPSMAPDPFLSPNLDGLGDLDPAEGMETGDEGIRSFAFDADLDPYAFYGRTSPDPMVLREFGAGDIFVAFKSEKFFLRAQHSSLIDSDDGQGKTMKRRLKIRPNMLVELATPTTFEGDAR